LTSENIGHEGFSKTIINTNPSPAPIGETVKPAKTKATTKLQTVELLNPGFEEKAKAPAKSASTNDEDTGLPELSLGEEKMLLEFASKELFEDSFRFIQAHPEVFSRVFSDQLMARAFSLQMKGKSVDARKCCKWALALNYSLQLGPQGVGMFYKRMMSGNQEAIMFFEDDLNKTFSHIQERCKILAANKQKEPEWNENNSNLNKEEAEAFKTFPKHFQQALLSNDMTKINESFKMMGETEANRVMELCQKVGLISVLSEDEAKKMMEQDKAAKVQ
jgi:cell division cycle protein 37